METKKVDQFSATQWAYFTLIQGASFNKMDGEEIVADLRANSGAWERVIPSFNAVSPTGEFKVREALTGDRYIDTLYIKFAGGNPKILKDLSEKWRADEYGWVEGKTGLVWWVWWD